jgi:predicted transcriptional regulator
MPDSDPQPQLTNRITDPRALRALAHPIRLTLLGLLRSEGPLTATKAAELIGESSASCSFHLRQLGKYGLVEEAGGGQGRERPWRATALFTDVPVDSVNPEFSAAAGLFTSLVLERYFENTMRWLEARDGEPAEWQRAASFSDRMLYVTADELEALRDQIQALLDGYLDRITSPELRPPGSRLVGYVELAFPMLDRPSGAAR